MPSADLAFLSTWFSAYVAAFCRRDPGAAHVYRMKSAHTRRVRQGMRRLGTAAGLAGRELALAEAAGLLHDVGRFPQYERHRTFRDDRSEHHGRLAVEAIEAEGLLAAWPADERRRVLAAVGHHNEPRLRALGDPGAAGLLKLLRDADKLDILRMAAARSNGRRRGPVTDFNLPETGACSPAALEAVLAGRVMPITAVSTRADAVLFYLSWVYDLNFPSAFRQVIEAGWLERLAAAIPSSAGTAEVLRALRAHATAGAADV
jgi:hypothetical protein